jgi:hypothetical protein
MVTPRGKIRTLLAHGKVLHAIATLVYKPANGALPITTVKHVTLR